ncbi:hypothetical protein [Escherichia coli]|uniref:hypothetical protein n=1 Tax=Escherichia coli TaxID=562 RepID=UPI00028E9A19|nr:hypothetical protein [Escherichia coli]EFC1702788.1 hypothetical protein [Escherichia coli]EFL9510320.1 hypothetical protein [Escherichia coli]EFL9664462.1 hypothetical protein [Escherichia coli]EKJ84777.1 hypothetical protein ECAD30_04910 [Escherichia coli AD30]MBA1016989.1 hypothetical protein [Escherichia coli]
MTELTKEQLIEEAKLKIAIAKCHPNSGMARVEGELFKIALASLVAEPVAWTDDEELRDVEQIGLGYLLPCPPDKYADPRRVIPLYRVPPVPTVQAPGIEIAINELVSLSPRLDKRAVETLSMAVAHLRKLVKKQIQAKD